jgi:hypothetical protein
MIDQPAIGDVDRLARKQPEDAGKDRLRARRELSLQHFVARSRAHRTLCEARRKQRLRFGRKGEALRNMRIVERFYAKRIT